MNRPMGRQKEWLLVQEFEKEVRVDQTNEKGGCSGVTVRIRSRQEEVHETGAERIHKK